MSKLRSGVRLYSLTVHKFNYKWFQKPINLKDLSAFLYLLDFISFTDMTEPILFTI